LSPNLISGDGRYVVFVSEASNLTRDSGRHVAQVYWRDIVNRVTELVSRNPSGRRPNGPSVHPAVSHDGSTVAFQSLASDLLCIDHCDDDHRDINLVWDVFVHDRRTRHTIRASAGDGDEEWMESSRAPSLDGTGRRARVRVATSDERPRRQLRRKPVCVGPASLTLTLSRDAGSIV